ncbi:thiamine ABC transporter substrate-binding protein [Natronorubrum tibetense]|uniref:ABC transporter substrate-binding protein n=1 Tax=Natronorubrum tibetense GA33 TaxID=1114856 RepID=L9VFH8_9EURY|nr:thiamine ABC transporter substrate-binding protein [Natronorubrum tibetense]ELY35965.1 ABC transporter substrate-binding protein [Natronorubrum tibetense GA33]
MYDQLDVGNETYVFTTYPHRMKRRTVVRTIGVGTGTAVGLAGCLTRNGDDDPPNGDEDGDPEPDEPDYEGTLRIATYGSMVTGQNPAGPWLEETFVEEYPDAELEWVVPNTGLQHYIRRGEYDADIDVDVLFGFTVGDLARIDDRIGDGGLLRELNLERIDGHERIRDDLALGDPHNRSLTYDTGYVSLVYDETEVGPVDGFDDLLGSAYENDLLAQHPVTSNPGQAFLLWTIQSADAETAFEYWEELLANGVQVHDSWSDAYYGAYLEAERPMVVSYSTDPLFAATESYEPERHRVAFPNDEGYAVPEGVGIFETSEEPDLAYAFLEHVLSPEIQLELARRNVQFPAVEDVTLPPEFGEAARQPTESVTTSYTELRGHFDQWLDDWTERFGDRFEDQ